MLSGKKYDKVYIRDIFQFLAPFSERGQRPQGGAKRMNKYELAVVVSAKLEDDARTATVEKVKEYIHVLAVQLRMLTNGVRRNLLTTFRK